MHSPLKKYKVSLNDGGGRLIYFGGNELAAIQDTLGRAAVEIFWDFTNAAKKEDPEERGREILRVFGDKEMLVLLHLGIVGGGGNEEKYTQRVVGSLIHTDILEKTKYANALLGALSIALFGKDPEALEEDAAAKKAEEPVDEEGDPLPNPT